MNASLTPTILQGEGGEQRCIDAFALLPWPAFSLGTCAIPVGRRGSSDGILDTMSMPERVLEVHTLFAKVLWKRRGFKWTKVKPKYGILFVKNLSIVISQTWHQGFRAPVGAPRFCQSAFGQVDC